jgi:predicted permease
MRHSSNPDSMSPLRVAALMVSVLVLAAACANLANMLLARGAHQAGEVAIRVALGASRVRIARIFIAEIALIAGVAGAVGVGLAVAGLRIFQHAVPSMAIAPGVELTPDLTLDVRMLVYAFLASASAAGAVGAIAAWRGSTTAPGRTLAAASPATSSASRARLLRTGMVAIQVTVALVLVMAAGLYLETMIVELIERGIFGRRVNYDTSRVVAARLDLGPDGFHEARGRYFLDRALDAVLRLQDVEAVAIASGLPGALRPLAPREMYLVLDDTATALAGHPGRGAAEYLSVSPGFLATIGLPVKLGRGFLDSDDENSERVAILSQRTAEILWPSENPIGKRIAGPSNMLPTGNRLSSWAVAPTLMTVIGVVDDPVTPNHLAPYHAAAQFVFVPFAQHYTPAASIVVRTARPDALDNPLRQTLRAIDPEVPLLDTNTVESTVLAWIRPMRAATLLAGSLAALSLGIAALGVYGVITFFTTSRTREFGIRLALGATPRQVTKLVLDDAVRIVLIGLLPGVFIAAVGSRYVEARVFGIMPNSITNWVVVPIVVLAAGVLAAYRPARRASRIDPNDAVREL